MDDLDKIIKKVSTGAMPYKWTHTKFGKRKHTVSKRRRKIKDAKMLEDAGIKGVDW
jgi:hypothetical protein